MTMPAQAQAIIGGAVTAQIGLVGALTQAGAQYILVPTIPDLGLTPASRAGGGILTAADFAAYRVREMAPLRCAYRGHVFVSAPPPSSGGTTICQILGILEGYDLPALGFRSAESVHLMVEAMRHAYLDRNTHLGDPDFVKNPVERLISADYAAAIRAKIGRPVAEEDDVFLLSYYRQLKSRLERKLLFGKRREDKYASD